MQGKPYDAGKVLSQIVYPLSLSGLEKADGWDPVTYGQRCGALGEEPGFPACVEGFVPGTVVETGLHPSGLFFRGVVVFTAVNTTVGNGAFGCFPVCTGYDVLRTAVCIFDLYFHQKAWGTI